MLYMLVKVFNDIHDKASNVLQIHNGKKKVYSCLNICVKNDNSDGIARGCCIIFACVVFFSMLQFEFLNNNNNIMI